MKTTSEIPAAPLHSRRDFFMHACQAMTLLTVASAIDACGGSSTSPSFSAPLLPTISASVAGGAINITVDASSPLSAVGSAALVQTSSGNFLVGHTGQDAFTALTAICTHQQCTSPASRTRPTSVPATAPATASPAPSSRAPRPRRCGSSRRDLPTTR